MTVLREEMYRKIWVHNRFVPMFMQLNKHRIVDRPVSSSDLAMLRRITDRLRMTDDRSDRLLDAFYVKERRKFFMIRMHKLRIEDVGWRSKKTLLKFF